MDVPTRDIPFWNIWMGLFYENYRSIRIFKNLPDVQIRHHLLSLGLGDPVRPPASYLEIPQLWFFILQNQKKKLDFRLMLFFVLLLNRLGSQSAVDRCLYPLYSAT